MTESSEGRKDSLLAVEPWLDTSGPFREPMLYLISWLAEQERERCWPELRPVRWEGSPAELLVARFHRLPRWRAVRRAEFSKGPQWELNRHDCIHVALDQSAEVAAPSNTPQSPGPAVGVVAVVRDGDDSVQLESHRLDDVVVRGGVWVPRRSQR